jgi:hypothetical protein
MPELKRTNQPIGTVQPKPPDGIVMQTLRVGQLVVGHASRAVAGVTSAASKAVQETDKMVRKSKVGSMTPDEVASVRLLFDEADVRNDGQLNKQELRHCLFKLTGRWLSVDEMDLFWRDIDTDGSYMVSFEEFLAHAGPILYPPVAYRLMRTAADHAKRVQDLGESAVEEAAISATDPLVDVVISRVEHLLNENIVDIDMPAVIQSASRRVIHSVVQDLRIELRELALHNIRKLPEEREPAAWKNPITRLLKGTRGWFLYTLAPYDRSVWLQLKNPGFIILKLISIYPPPVQPLFFIVQFLRTTGTSTCSCASYCSSKVGAARPAAHCCMLRAARPRACWGARLRIGACGPGAAPLTRSHRPSPRRPSRSLPRGSLSVPLCRHDLDVRRRLLLLPRGRRRCALADEHLLHLALPRTGARHVARLPVPALLAREGAGGRGWHRACRHVLRPQMVQGARRPARQALPV